MANMEFCDKHNMVAFLQKPSGSEEFHQIVDFLAGSHIRYDLTANSTIYRSIIEQFWQTATVEMINEREQQITATVDGHKLSITEASVRGHLQLADDDGISSLPNTEIFEQLSLMGQGEGLTPSVESQHTPTASSPSTSHHTTSQPTTSQYSPEPTTEPFTTIPSPEPQDTQIPQTTTFVPHDTPLSGGYTPRSVEGSMKLQELTDLYTELVDRVASLETKLKITKEVYGKALTKLVKKVKRLEDKLKSTTKRKAHMVISDEEEDLALEDPSKQERMEETEYADIEEEYAGVEHDFDLSEHQVTPAKFHISRETIWFNDKISNSQEEASYSSSSKEEHDDIFEEYGQSQDDLFQSFKKLRIAQDSSSEPFQEQSTEEPKELSEEDVKKMLEIVPVKEFRVEALQTKYPIVDWEIHSEDLRKYWKIIRASNITEAYQSFKDLRKAFNKEDLDILWRLVKERFTSAAPAEDMEKALWVELKRLNELDKDDILWKL
ncbi:hypothetical protein Tco_0037740 [Tanacetum coccineum]